VTRRSTTRPATASTAAPQTEDAAEELDEYVQRQAQQVAAESGDGRRRRWGLRKRWNAGNDGGGSGSSRPSNSPTASSSGAAAATCSATGRLSSRSRWSAGRRLPLILGGIAILPPIRRLTAEPLGSPLKREVMAGLYAVFALLGVALLVRLFKHVLENRYRPLATRSESRWLPPAARTRSPMLSLAVSPWLAAQTALSPPPARRRSSRSRQQESERLRRRRARARVGREPRNEGVERRRHVVRDHPLAGGVAVDVQRRVDPVR